MKRLLLFLPLLLVDAVLAGDSYLRQLPVGTTLVLNQPVQIPAHTATVYFQGGRVVAPADLDEYLPHCLLLSRVVAERPQPVSPGEFRIQRVFPYEEQHSRAGTQPLRVAGFGVGISIGDSGGDGGRTTYYFTTRMELASAQFPDAIYFECRHLSDYAIGDHIRVTQFSSSVGDLWSLRPAG